MEQQVQNRVFNNDYIMTRILRMMDPQDQYHLQKCCQRLRYLVIDCVWKQDWTVMKRVQVFGLTDEEFLECVLLNANNIEKLTIYLNDDNDFQKYFPRCYENLVELKIDGMNNCEWNSFSTLYTLKKLKILKLKDLTNTIPYGDVWALAAKVPLRVFDIHGVYISMTEIDVQNDGEDLQGLERLEIVNTCCSHTCDENKDCLKVLRRSPNIKEFIIVLHERLVDGLLFDKFTQLERVRMFGCSSAALKISGIMQQTKHLHVWTESLLDDHSEIKTDEGEMYADLLTLDVAVSSTTCFCNYWTALFQSPSTSFKNLQHLQLNVSVDDAFVRCISLKCTQLKELMLSGCHLSGKYINHFPNLKELELSYACILWSNLYSILHDLKLLERLGFYGVALKRNHLPDASVKRNLGNSLKYMDMALSAANDKRFWQYLSKNAAQSFQKLRSVVINEVNVGTYDLRTFFANFPRLHKLKIACTEISFTGVIMPPTVKHLSFNRGRQTEWKNIVAMLNGSNIEILEIFQADDDDDGDDVVEEVPVYHPMDILKQLNSITMPYKYYERNSAFWRQTLSECDHFQLRCIDSDDKEVLKVLPLLLEGVAPKQRVKAIYLKFKMESFSSIRKYCIEDLALAKVPIFYLANTNKRLWETMYTFRYVVIIEV